MEFKNNNEQLIQIGGIISSTLAIISLFLLYQNPEQIGGIITFIFIFSFIIFILLSAISPSQGVF